MQKMERPNSFLVNGGVKLPIGYRFLPTDEELVVHYLRRKAFGLPLPAFVIPEFDLFKSHPDSLPGDAREKNRYFFYRRKWNAYGNYRCKRPAGSGYWKHVGKERQVVASGTNQTVGIRRTLVFVEPKKPCNGTKTRWFMREYCLVSSAATPQVTGMESGDEWIVYKVYQRKRKGNGRKKSGINGVFVSPSCCIDYRMQADATDTGPPPPSPQSSSIVAPAFSNGLQDQEDEEISTCSRAS